MKGKVKFLSAAAAALLFASCSSDDLNLGSNAIFSGKADLIGSLGNTTRAGMVDGGDDDKAVVWSQGDVINVYSPNVLKYNTYALNAGSEGTQEGAFTRQGDDNIDIATVGATNCYAVTASENVYGVSATADGKMKLTAKIPQEFQWEEVAYDADNNYYVNPSIFWGKLSAFENDVLKVNFQPLMAMLKVDVALLKTGTKALVLVSKTEPLSGTFNAILEEDGKLAPDAQLVNYKAIRINTETLTEDANKVFYIPVLAQKYEEFAVYGIIRDAGDTGYAASGNPDWSGVDRGTIDADYYEIEDLENVTFANGQRRTLARMVEQDITATSLYEASQAIAGLMDGVHAVKVNVTLPAAFNPTSAATAKKKFGTTNATAGDMNGDQVLYIPNNIKGDIIIKFANSLPAALDIIEAPAYKDADGDIQFKIPFKTATSNEALAAGESYSYYYDATAGAKVAVPSAAKARTVTLNLLGTGAATDKAINAYLPTTNLILGNTGAATYGTSTTEAITAITANTCTIDRDQSAAGLTVKGEIFNVVSAAQNAGGIVIAGDVTQLDVNNPAQATSWVKLEDASVATINYVAQSTETFIYTTGEAAINTLNEAAGATDKVGVRSYWTGKKCPAAAGTTIFTAGQLAAIDGTNTTYTVSEKVSFIHLGGQTYPWVGPAVTPTGAFTFDGNNRPLQSMKLATKDLTGAAIATNNGLFRNINAAGNDVVIKGVDLWDVLADGIECDNVGAIAGNVSAKALTLGAASKPVNVKYVQLSADGDNVGGLFGTANLTNALTTAANITLTGSEVKGTGSNVGGLFGELTTTAAVTLNSNVIKVQNYTSATKLSIVAGGDNAGGLFGNLNGAAAVNIKDAAVNVDAISAAGANVGGLAGSLTAGAASAIDKVSVAAASGISGLNTVGGLVGISNITGGVTMDAGAHTAPISVDANLTATNENVGGLIGNAYVGAVTISNSAPTGNVVSIKVKGALTGAYAVGGMIGTSAVTTSITGVGTASKAVGIDLTGVTFANSWAAADFDTPTLKLYCGSFAYLVGYVKGNTTYVSTDGGTGTTLKKGIDLPAALNPAARKALHFDVNKGNETTAGSTFGFWGQDDMYVGFVNTGVITGLGATLTAGTEYNVYDNVY